MLAGTIGERNLWKYAALNRTAEYISSQLTASGYTPRRQTFEVSKLPVSNLEATLSGTARAHEIIVVGAHSDTVPGCPGANDNGTGVAAVLDLAQRFSRQPQPRTVRFVGFVNEEPPFFQTAQMGSVVYASAAKANGEQVKGMLSSRRWGTTRTQEAASLILRLSHRCTGMSATSSALSRTSALPGFC
jgi:hypothetical protein